MQRRLGDARIFSFGVGSSTNRYLLDHMAMLGRGAVAYLGLNEDRCAPSISSSSASATRRSPTSRSTGAASA